MNRALIPVTVVTLFIVAIQLAILSSLRIDGVVVMLVWLWPLALGLAGSTVLAMWGAVWGALLGGIFFDTHAATPFGLTALVGVAIAYVASRLGREGVGDLDSAAIWVTPAIAAVAGFVAPLAYIVAATATLHFTMWRASLGESMIVNAIAFFLLARPVGRLAILVSGSGARARR